MSSLVIRGRRLESTPVFDTYWRFAARRQAIYLARVAGCGPPWSDDETLRRFRFTNPFRASDRVSQFLIRNVIYGDGAEFTADDIVFRTLLFKFFNRIETWQHLEKSVGTITWHSFDRSAYQEALDVLSERGPIYSAAYVIPPPRMGAARKHHNHLRLLQRMMREGLPERVTNADSLEELFGILLRYPSIGRFLAFQFSIDLNYGPLTTFDEDSFVEPGPGAIDGLRKCFGAEVAGREVEVIRYMVDSQEEHFARLGLEFDGLWGRRLHLIDCQNLFCEVDKYARVAHPAIRGVSGRSRIKQLFRPRLDPVSAFFPPKWRVRVSDSFDDGERSRL